MVEVQESLVQSVGGGVHFPARIHHEYMQRILTERFQLKSARTGDHFYVLHAEYKVCRYISAVTAGHTRKNFHHKFLPTS